MRFIDLYTEYRKGNYNGHHTTPTHNVVFYAHYTNTPHTSKQTRVYILKVIHDLWPKPFAGKREEIYTPTSSEN